MSDQLIVIPASEFREIIKSEVNLVLTSFFNLKEQQQAQEEKPVVYRTREYVKDLLHTTYPTLDKWSESGLLKKHYFGRRVLYRDDELNVALSIIKNFSNNKNKKAA